MVKSDLEIENKQLRAFVDHYEGLIEDIYQHCLCERFSTYGFDYHEKHPRRPDCERGSRVKTPRTLIEDRLGFDWVYKSNKIGDSKKVLRLIKNGLQVSTDNFNNEE